MKDSLKWFRMSGRAGTVARLLIWVSVGVLLATQKSRPWPVEVSVQADSDTTVVVTWHSQDDKNGFCEEPPPDPYDSFELYFRPVGETSWTAIARTRDTFMAHDPRHLTGRYSVRGWRRDEVEWDTLRTYATTEPSHIGPVRLHEVNTGDTSAFGFDYYYGSHMYVMDTTTITSGPDAYVTDYRPGTPGPLFIVSPSVVSSDSGVRVFERTFPYWRRTAFSTLLAEEPKLLPAWEPFTWSQVCSLKQAPQLIAFYKENDSYGLIEVLSLGQSYVEVEAWYQQTRGLRLIGH